jgi:hypothetical protein
LSNYSINGTTLDFLFLGLEDVMKRDEHAKDGIVSVLYWGHEFSPRGSRTYIVSSPGLGVCCFDSDDRLFLSCCNYFKRDYNQFIFSQIT